MVDTSSPDHPSPSPSASSSKALRADAPTFTPTFKASPSPSPRGSFRGRASPRSSSSSPRPRPTPPSTAPPPPKPAPAPRGYIPVVQKPARPDIDIEAKLAAKRLQSEEAIKKHEAAEKERLEYEQATSREQESAKARAAAQQAEEEESRREREEYRRRKEADFAARNQAAATTTSEPTEDPDRFDSPYWRLKEVWLNTPEPPSSPVECEMSDVFSKKDTARLKWLESKNAKEDFDYDDDDDMTMVREMWDLQAALSASKKRNKKNINGSASTPSTPALSVRAAPWATPAEDHTDPYGQIDAVLATPVLQHSPPTPAPAIWAPAPTSPAIRMASPPQAVPAQLPVQVEVSSIADEAGPSESAATPAPSTGGADDIEVVPVSGAMVPWPETGVVYKNARPPQDSIPEPTPLPRRARPSDGGATNSNDRQRDNGYGDRASNGNAQPMDDTDGWGSSANTAQNGGDDGGWGEPAHQGSGGDSGFVNPARQTYINGGDRPPRGNWEDRRNQANDDSTRGGFGGASNDCFKCGQPGHFSRECPQAGGGGGRGDGCFRCGEQGHMSRECPQGGGGGRGDRCFRCGENGHMSRECPNGGQGGFGGDRGGGECFKCGKPGHISRECPDSAGASFGEGGYGGDRGGYCGSRGGNTGGFGTGSNAGARDNGWGARGGGSHTGRDKPPHQPASNLNGWGNSQQNNDGVDQWGAPAPSNSNGNHRANDNEWGTPTGSNAPARQNGDDQWGASASQQPDISFDAPPVHQDDEQPVAADSGGDFGGW